MREVQARCGSRGGETAHQKFSPQLVSLAKKIGSITEAGRGLPRSVVYKALGDLREGLLKGEKIKNKCSYLLTLMKLEAKKRNLPWALKA